MVRLDSQTFPFTLQSQVACSVSNNELLYHKNFMLQCSNFSIAYYSALVKQKKNHSRFFRRMRLFSYFLLFWVACS